MYPKIAGGFCIVFCLWQHVDTCDEKCMQGICPMTPVDCFPDMDHIELQETKMTKEGMLAYSSTLEA